MLIKFLFSNQKESMQRFMIITTYLMIRLVSWSFKFPIEPILDFITIFIVIVLTRYVRMSLKNINAEVIITLQIFIALQWMNTMPTMTSFYVGHTELPASIKIAGAYLDNTVIQMHDLQGRLVKSINRVTEELSSIDISDLANNLYLLSIVVDGEKIHTEKVVIQK